MKILRMENNIAKLNSKNGDNLTSKQDLSQVQPVSRKNSDVIEISPEARQAWIEKKKRQDYEKEAGYLKWLYLNSDRIAGRTSEDPESMAAQGDLPWLEEGLVFLADLLTG